MVVEGLLSTMRSFLGLCYWENGSECECGSIDGARVLTCGPSSLRFEPLKLFSAIATLREALL